MMEVSYKMQSNHLDVDRRRELLIVDECDQYRVILRYTELGRNPIQSLHTFVSETFLHHPSIILANHQRAMLCASECQSMLPFSLGLNSND